MMQPFSFACPLCQHPLEVETAVRYRCPQDSTVYEQVDGIWRFLPPGRAAHWAPFIGQYEAIRQAEDRGSHEASFYRSLPFVSPVDAQARFWRGRVQSYRVLLQEVISKLERPQVVDEKGEEIAIIPLKIADLGAGNGWMSYSLTQIGHQVAAVDLLTNTMDGLGAFVHYNLPLTRLQAEFDRLPLGNNQFDVVVFNASFHYAADYAITLLEAQRVLRPNGIIAIVDTPLYQSVAAGQQMVVERAKLFAEQYGCSANSLAAENFLTYGRLAQLAEQVGLSYTVIATIPLWRRVWRRLKRRLRGERPTAEFPLVVWLSQYAK